MSRHYTAQHVSLLREQLSGSIVELVAFRRNANEVAHLGTGIIVGYDDDSRCIGVITTISCNPKEYRVLARFAGHEKNLETEVLVEGTFLSGLVIRGYDGVVGVVPVTTDALFEKNPERSEPVWTAGCFSGNLEEIMPGGSICVRNIPKIMRKKDPLQTFIHSCPIGDGLIGAPVVNRFGKILGITVARTKNTACLNYGMRLEELKKELAQLAVGASSEESMSSLLGKFSTTLLGKRAKKSDAGSLPKKTKRSDAGSSSKMTKRGDAGSSSKKARIV